ncbi:Ribonuclease H [Hypsizygus marmoreus]|uniref:ribonuclease H n=1 Tax=Hypsizygus marmoreus TaxID=39966 RepID=A0A369K8Z4_HYPMA|nr:Ribonuclease H [Hypsizygus marmoreus]
MPKPTKGGFYAVKDGRKTGVFLTWDECEQQIKGYPGAKFKKFTNAAEAEAFASGEQSTSTIKPAEASTSKEASTDSKGKKRAMSPNVEDESGWDVVYCDGACKGNGKTGSIAGVGVWWGEGDPRNIAERCPGDQTNNRAELIAIIRILETTPTSKKPLLIKSDSQYSINCFKLWLPNWVRNNFRTASGGPVKNVGIIRYLSALLDARALRGQKIRLQYVKGHSGERGNDGADAQANLGALLPPVPERDWEQAENDLRDRVEAELSHSARPPVKVPLEVEGEVPATSPDSPVKVRKVSNDLPSSRFLTAVAAVKAAEATSPSRAFHNGPPSTPTSPHKLEVPPSPSKVPHRPTSPSPAPLVYPSRKPVIPAHKITSPKPITAPQARAPSSPQKPLKTSEGRLVESPRRPGSAPNLKSPLGTPSKRRGFADLPSASERHARIMASRSPQPEPLQKIDYHPKSPIAVAVRKEDINIDDYLDCIIDDDEIWKDL